MIQQIIVIILAFLGSLAGRWLAVLAPEEISVGKRYFLFSKKVLMALLSLLLVSQIPSLSFSLLFFVFIGGLLGYVIHRQPVFFSFALVATSFLSLSVFFISAVFIFLHGMVTGSVERQPPSSIFFFFLPLLLFLFPSFVSANLSGLLAVTIGALLVSAK